MKDTHIHRNTDRQRQTKQTLTAYNKIICCTTLLENNSIIIQHHQNQIYSVPKRDKIAVKNVQGNAVT